MFVFFFEVTSLQKLTISPKCIENRYFIIHQNYKASGNSELNAEADAITFEGKCPNIPYYICSMIEGDNHLDLFQNELVHLDKEVYLDRYTSLYAEDYNGPYGTGSRPWEFSGTFGFEVVE